MTIKKITSLMVVKSDIMGSLREGVDQRDLMLYDLGRKNLKKRAA